MSGRVRSRGGESGLGEGYVVRGKKVRSRGRVSQLWESGGRVVIIMSSESGQQSAGARMRGE